MADGRLTAAQAHKTALTAQKSTQRKRVDPMLSEILRRISCVAHDKEFSLEFGFLPPNLDLVEDASAELAILRYVVKFDPLNRVLTISW